MKRPLIAFVFGVLIALAGVPSGHAGPGHDHKTAPQRFEPRTVITEALDGVIVAVTSGLEPGDRVATQGATLINQVR